MNTQCVSMIRMTKSISVILFWASPHLVTTKSLSLAGWRSIRPDRDTTGCVGSGVGLTVSSLALGLPDYDVSGTLGVFAVVVAFSCVDSAGVISGGVECGVLLGGVLLGGAVVSEGASSCVVRFAPPLSGSRSSSHQGVSGLFRAAILFLPA